ncbi:unnamed protein product [Clonostachys rosea f. rosea IK726]|uniref:Uncharacterized protein n=1 Tax=Clonostachys rosea f. rosea IK726 TaxID=1349383 RepID=A0ACA9UL32_BIOOC|nr:unnamed protein product [Clonostachys rosea f. rosea IK726]
MSGFPEFPSFTKTWHNKPYASISPSRPELSAKGKFVVVTGGGVGIGVAIATAYAQAGAKFVAILGRRLHVLQEAAERIRSANPEGSTTVLFERADVGKRDSLAAAFNAFASKTGAQIDILVSNAGTLPDPSPVLSSKEDVIRDGLETNVIGALNVAVPGGTWAYAATKIAVTKMFDYLQFENPDMHIVNIQPGVVASDMNTKHGAPPQDEAELPGQFCVWLASKEAKFLKNRYVWANWDVDELKSRAQEIESSFLFKIKLMAWIYEFSALDAIPISWKAPINLARSLQLDFSNTRNHHF